MCVKSTCLVKSSSKRIFTYVHIILRLLIHIYVVVYLFVRCFLVEVLSLRKITFAQDLYHIYSNIEVMDHIGAAENGTLTHNNRALPYLYLAHRSTI